MTHRFKPDERQLAEKRYNKNHVKPRRGEVDLSYWFSTKDDGKTILFWFKQDYDFDVVCARILDCFCDYDPVVINLYFYVEVQLGRFISWRDAKRLVNDALKDLA